MTRARKTAARKARRAKVLAAFYARRFKEVFKGAWLTSFPPGEATQTFDESGWP